MQNVTYLIMSLTLLISYGEKPTDRVKSQTQRFLEGLLTVPLIMSRWLVTTLKTLMQFPSVRSSRQFASIVWITLYLTKRKCLERPILWISRHIVKLDVPTANKKFV